MKILVRTTNDSLSQHNVTVPIMSKNEGSEKTTPFQSPDWPPPSPNFKISSRWGGMIPAPTASRPANPNHTPFDRPPLATSVLPPLSRPSSSAGLRRLGLAVLGLLKIWKKTKRTPRSCFRTTAELRNCVSTFFSHHRWRLRDVDRQLLYRIPLPA